MGVLATPSRQSQWTADPEALLVFTFQVARTDPRLFDEVLDWIVLNEELISAQRLRNMAGSEEDRRLVEAVLTWLRTQRRRTPMRVTTNSGARITTELLFYEHREPQRPDPSFAAHGFLKPLTRATGKSQSPDLRLPINFAFVLRHVFGVSSRAEVMRFLLTATRRSPMGSAPLFTALAIADAAGFAKRNVQETLNSLVSGNAVGLIVRGHERVYSVEVDAWAAALNAAQPLPSYRDWPHALLAFRELHRWIWRSDLEKLTPYMQASEARKLMDDLVATLAHAGIPVHERQPVTGAEYWETFVDRVEQALSQLESGLPW
jgi:hypothetical protein